MSEAASRRRLRWAPLAGVLAVALVMGATASTALAGPRAHAQAAAPQDLAHPTKALCKKSSYKIGYDVFSGNQPFAVSLTNGILDAAKKVGCVKILKTVDNLNGPVAVGNLKTLINEGIDGFIDFQVLAAFQTGMAKTLKSKKIPAVTVVGAELPGFPQVGLAPFQTEEKAAIYMATIAKKRFPGKIPYFLGGAEPTSGAAVLARYKGAVAGIKKVFPNIPSNQIIEVKTEGVATTAYDTTISALSAVPSNAVVLMQAVNDEDLGGMYKAAQARHVQNFLVNSFGGDSYGLAQVCADPVHYVGAWYLNPAGWGPVLLSLIMNNINGVAVPHNTNILGYEVTHNTPFLKCKK
jgi:ABC-type sugar transport system substrate-binding protein